MPHSSRGLLLLALALLPSGIAAAATVNLTAPPARGTTAGLGFSVAAVLWSQTADTLQVTVAGAPEGLSIRFVRLRPDYGVATVSGVIPMAKKSRDYNLTWSVTGPGGRRMGEARTTLTVDPPRNAGGNMKNKVRDLVCKRYAYGIDALEMRNLGAEALPHLFRTLRDPACGEFLSSAVAAEGILGLPAAFDSVRVFLWNRFAGDVEPLPREAVQALFYAPVAAGMIADSRPDAVDSLIAWTDPRYWMRLPWHYGSLTGKDLGIFMSGRAMQGLSLVSDGRAVAALERLGANPYDRAQLPYVQRALERQRKVLERGWQAVREEERLEQQ